jgi:hypothetical protein
MHVRRKFFEAVDAPKDLREAVLRAIRHIFRYDKFARRHPSGGDELVLAVRREKIAPLIDWLFARTSSALTGGEVLPASAFAGAIGYMHILGNALRTFLADARLRPDNGESERALRPLAIGRNNAELDIMLSKGPLGAHRGAGLALLVGLCPWHNQRPSRNARSASGGEYRTGRQVGSSSAASARSFIARSAST